MDVLVLPNFLIVGAPRSGTTSLARYLGAHPQVFMAADKEVRFFGAGFDRGLEWYAKHFAGAGTQPRVGEATPTYLADPQARRRLAATLPEAKLIAILRDPVDRAYSQYWLARSLGTEDRTFEAAIGVAGGADATDRPLRRYLEQGRYVEQLRDLCTLYPRDAVHVEIFEDFVAAPAERFRSVCRFLDVDDTVVPDLVGATVNRHVDHRSPSLHRAARDLPRPIRRALGRLNARPATYPPMAPATRAELRSRFEGPNDELARWLGRDLSEWGR
jgi:hypothetical protein